MGLDMYFFTQKPDCDPHCPKEEIAYFRKHSDLHGWMDEEWRKLYGDDIDFNCEYLEITEDMLKRLSDYLKLPEKKHYKGFFWGTSTDEDWKETKKLIPELKKRMKNGERIYYYSWW